VIRPIITVPPALFRQTRFTWDIDWRGQGGQDLTDGHTVTVINAFPRWVGTPSLYLDAASVLRWRAFRAAAQGLVGLYLIEMADVLTYLPPPPSGGVTFSTNVPFSTGSMFRFDPFYVATAAAAAGSREIEVGIVTGDVPPVVGQILSHNHWPFIVSYVDPLADGETIRLGVEMNLREAIAAGAPVSRRPTGLFEAVDPSKGNPEYGRDHRSQPTLQFHEFLNR